MGLTTLEKRRQRGDLIAMYKILTGKENLDSANFFMKIRSDHDLRGHSLKLFKARFQLACRQYSFSQRAIDVWNRLPSNVIEATSVNGFKNRLDKIWSSTDGGI